jgi:hypothetical protein
MSSFAKGLEQDLDAVTQGLTSRWNSGPVEGRVNHIKMSKRQMFGRAGLPLLGKRVLLTPPGLIDARRHRIHHGIRARAKTGGRQPREDKTVYPDFPMAVDSPRPNARLCR